MVKDFDNEECVVKITNLVKEYKMFERKKDRLLETILPKYQKHNTFRAMDNLNLELHRGEILGILGRNGAGKSTLLKMITGVVVPTSGTIEIKGKISSLLELGTAFNGELTGIENIYQHGQVMGLTNEEIKAKENEIIEFADIGDHIHQPVKTYSSGMFARLAFACAINVDPDILIVDEVLSVGDMAFQLKCFKKFEQFKAKGKTIIFVTHSIHDVLKNCTKTIIIDGGKKIFEGSTKDGVEKYKKMIVGIDINPKEENVDAKDLLDKEIILKNDSVWKDNFNQNPNLIEYGNKKAEVIDYGMFDENDVPLNILSNDQTVVLKSKILFHQDVKDPIFTMTVKDFHGVEMCGTNTDVEKILTGNYKRGEVAICEFKQHMPLMPGKYTLSFSCTRYTETGELEALNRKYDALLIEVISTKNTVGMFRIDSEIKTYKLDTGINIEDFQKEETKKGKKSKKKK